VSRRRTPKYKQGTQRVILPLSDGRTVGVCKVCGKQHPPARRDWETDPTRCNDPKSVFIPEHMRAS